MKEQKLKIITAKIPNEETIKVAFKEGKDSVKKLVFQLTNSIQNLTEHIEKQNEIIKKLDEQISKNSNNSSKPPSSDGYEKIKRTKSLREKSSRKKWWSIWTLRSYFKTNRKTE